MVRIRESKYVCYDGIEVRITPDSDFFYVMLTIPNPVDLDVKRPEFNVKLKMKGEIQRPSLVLSKHIRCKDFMIYKGYYVNFQRSGLYECTLFLKPEFILPDEDVKAQKKDEYERILRKKTRGRMNVPKKGNYTNFKYNNSAKPFKGGTFSHN